MKIFINFKNIIRIKKLNRFWKLNIGTFFKISTFALIIVIIFNFKILEIRLIKETNIFKKIIYAKNIVLKKENELNCDWIYLEPRTYFRTESSYFFSDVSLILLNFITLKHNNNLAFELFLKINNKKKRNSIKIKIKSAKFELIKEDIFNSMYGYYILKAEFLLQKYLLKYDWKMEDVILSVILSKSKQFFLYLI